MSLNQSGNSAGTKHRKLFSGKQFSYDLLAFTLLIILGGAAWFLLSSAGSSSFSKLAALIFSLDSQQVMWFITRSAGIIAYLLLWFSMVWGLVIPSKILGNRLSGDFTYDFHQFLSLLSLGFLGLHIFILTADRFLPFTLAQILVPFIAPYRPAWVGIGTVAMYLLILVTVTFYLRRRIGMKAFRSIHVTSLVAYLGAVAHAFMAGTDSSMPAIQLMYAGTFLVVVFLTVYWLASLVWTRRHADVHSARPLPHPGDRRQRPA